MALEERKAKVVLIGGPAVGKTSIISAYIDGPSTIIPPQTMCLAFSTKVEVIGDTAINLQICDTAGEERFQSVSPNFYRGAQAALVVFDVTSPPSFKKLRDWINELNATMADDFIKVVIGNKIDLDSQRLVTREAALEFSAANGATYLETSAKTGHGIQAAFQLVCEKILEVQAPKVSPANRNLELTAEGGARNEQKCCA
jgi:Ras-related protein Rab-5B